MQMGQFIDHDITHTPNHAKKCCNKDGSFPSTFDSNKCFPIEVPADDPFWTGRLRCMDLARSLSSPNLKCEIDSRQQVSKYLIFIFLWFLIDLNHPNFTIALILSSLYYVERICY